MTVSREHELRRHQSRVPPQRPTLAKPGGADTVLDAGHLTRNTSPTRLTVISSPFRDSWQELPEAVSELPKASQVVTMVSAQLILSPPTLQGRTDNPLPPELRSKVIHLLARDQGPPAQVPPRDFAVQRPASRYLYVCLSYPPAGGGCALTDWPHPQT